MSAAADHAAIPAAPLRVGERFARRVTFDDASIRRFAALCGDHNPLHHDVEAASRSAFGALIASGPHVTSMMMGLDATYLSGRGEALGSSPLRATTGSRSTRAASSMRSTSAHRSSASRTFFSRAAISWT
jgi:acyl dehydratase